jgi:hypothetical protein
MFTKQHIYIKIKYCCHPGMARPHTADRGDGLQIRRVAANILIKQSRTADRGWSSETFQELFSTLPELDCYSNVLGNVGFAVKHISKSILVPMDKMRNIFCIEALKI